MGREENAESQRAVRLIRKRYLSAGGLRRLRCYVGRMIGLGSPGFDGAVPRVPRSVWEHWWWEFLRWWQGRQARSPRKDRLEKLFFGSNLTSRAFDFFLLIAISVSVLLFMLETVASIYVRAAWLFLVIDWVLTIFFTLEFALRLYCAKNPSRYVRSFYGMVDLLSTLPLYLELLLPGMRYLLVLRVLRLLRVFRIFKLFRFIHERNELNKALRASFYRISYFLFLMVLLVCIIGTVMYIVEGGLQEGFASIPESIYWTIVTITTVGYGDISPVTALGRFLASVIMLLGYGIIAVPTGIVTAEVIAGRRSGGAKVDPTKRVCPRCGQNQHREKARFCDRCGERLGGV